MTDPRDPQDDAVRGALAAEAEGIEAGDDLLARIRGAGTTHRSSRRPLVLLAAALVAVAALAGGLALADRDGEDQSVIVDQPDRTTTPDATSTTACSPVANPPCGDAALEPGPRPTLVALVREDGWLVTVDLLTGEEQELAFRGDPNDREEETGMRYHIDSIDLSPDGQWIYYSTCCEPASGVTYRVRVGVPEGDEPEFAAQAATPAISPDGRYLAVTTHMAIHVRDLQADASDTDAHASFDVPGVVHGLAWSPDGTQLAYVDRGSDGGDLGSLEVLSWDGADLEAVTTHPAGANLAATFAGWWGPGMWMSVGGLRSSGPGVGDTEGGEDDLGAIDDRSFAEDASYRWSLHVDEAGVIEASRIGDGARSPIPGLPTATDADW